MEKFYKRKLFEGGTLYEAQMFYMPYFRLEKGVLKCVDNQISMEFKWLRDLSERHKVYYTVTDEYKQGVYYTLKDRNNKEQFYKDFEKGVILNERY